LSLVLMLQARVDPGFGSFEIALGAWLLLPYVLFVRRALPSSHAPATRTLIGALALAASSVAVLFYALNVQRDPQAALALVWLPLAQLLAIGALKVLLVVIGRKGGNSSNDHDDARTITA
jgi:hypothetical protein